MSRIRSVHPTLWTDDAFMGLSAHARLLVIGVWTEAWDDGVFEWKPLTLKARIFPVDAVDVAALLDELVAGDFVAKDEFNGRPIGMVRNFRTYQRPKKPNDSGMLKPEWRTFVGLTDVSGEPVPHHAGTSGEKSPQMEDGGGEDEDTSPPPVPVAHGARDDFDDLWSVFPQNPTSSETKAKAAFSATKAGDRPAILAAARRYRQWFTEDNATRKRTVDAGARFAPHLAKWLEDEAWRDAGKLAVKSDPDGPAIPMTKLDRDRDRDLWERCERLMGKRAPTSGPDWWFKTELVDQAKAEALH